MSILDFLKAADVVSPLAAVVGAIKGDLQAPQMPTSAQQVNDNINSALGAISPSFGAAYQADKQRVAEGKALGADVPANASALSKWMASDPTMHQIGLAFAPLSDIPGADAVFTALDTPRRAINAALISAQHTAATNDNGPIWGDFFNKETWSRAWGMAAMDQVNSPTSGQLLANGLFSMDQSQGWDPFNAQDALKLQENANNTWYGSLTSTVTDLGASMISVPGLGVVSRGKAAAGIQTAADANRVAERFNAAGAVGRTGIQKAGDKARQYLVPNGAQNVDALVQRQVEGLRIFDGNLDEGQVFNQLKARLPRAPEGDVAKLTNVFTQINREADPVVREQLRMNAFLASLGSTSAKSELIKAHPLLAKNLENLTSAPRETQAMAELYAVRLGDNGATEARVSDIVDSVWNRPGDREELARLHGEVDKIRSSRQEYDKLVSDLKALKPKVKDTPEGRHVKAKRQELADEVSKLQSELRTAKQDLHGTKRWAAGAAKGIRKDGVDAQLGNVQDFNQAIGDARRRVEDLQARLDAARSDRTLLEQTPVQDPQALQDWRAMVGEARDQRGVLRQALTKAEEEKKLQAELIRTKSQEIRAVSPYLGRQNAIINDILDIAGHDSAMALTGDAKPSALSGLKAHLRDRLGAEHYVTVGDGNRTIAVKSLPSRAAKWAMMPSARGFINLNEVGLGTRQLADAMQRSKVFTKDEIIAARNELIRLPEGNLAGQNQSARAAHVSKIQEEMALRMAQKAVSEWGIAKTPEEVLAHAKELQQFTLKHWGDGNQWVTKHANEAANGKYITVPDLDGPPGLFDGATLRSQLADSAPFLDPWDLENQLIQQADGFKRNLRNGLAVTANMHDKMIGLWKVGALLRPGLMTRSMLDTGPRALASLTAAESLMNTINGMAHIVHNRSLKGLAKVEFGGLTPAQAAERALYLDMKPVKAGGREFQLAANNTERQINQAAMTKGSTVHGALFAEVDKALSHLTADRSKWSRRKPDSALWHEAYKEYADMLLASPTARKVANLRFKSIDEIDPGGLIKAVKDSPEFLSEYRKLAQPQGLTREQFLQQIVHEVDAMFPSKEVLDAAQAGGLSKKFLDRQFPRTDRFEIPSPEFSAMEGGKFAVGVRKATNALFRAFLDKPDMWLARHPVASSLYRRRLQQEYAALERVNGPGYVLSEKEARLIDSRARGAAIGYVRDTFFDTTRYTGAHRALARVSPFIQAWEDAMVSWGRLIYDDPRRLTKLVAAYNAPYTIARSTNTNLVLDENGQPLPRGKDSRGVFVAIPLGVLGKKLGVPQYRMRLDAINSIWQGETWWLPGVGPTVSAPLTYVLGSGKVIPKEVALDLVNTDNEMGKAILKSVYLGGEVPEATAGATAMSVLPGWVRTIATDAFGEGKLRTQLYSYNQLAADAQKNGKQLSAEDQQRLWDEAGNTALSAAAVRVMMSGGLGATGTAATDAQFYVDQMRIIDAMPDEMRTVDGVILTPQEFFARQFPEAGQLKWSFTKNETGINATVSAGKAEDRMGSILKNNPADIGWMVLGRDNVGGEFSRTAYGMQKASGSRHALSELEVKTDAQAALGFQQLNAAAQQVADQLVAAGFDPATVTTTKEYRAAKRAMKDAIAADNPAFAEKSQQFSGKFDYYYSQAQRLSQSGPLKSRSDMQAFRDYDEARSEVLAYYGIKSFSGTSPQYLEAKNVMQYVGATLAKKDIGFSQMWDRFLEGEVD